MLYVGYFRITIVDSRKMGKNTAMKEGASDLRVLLI